MSEHKAMHYVNFNMFVDSCSCLACLHDRHYMTCSLHDSHYMICSAMQPQEKQQLATFGADARHRVAQQVKCNVSAVGHASPWQSNEFSAGFVWSQVPG